LAIGDCAQTQNPNPQSPIPNPQSPVFLYFIKNLNILIKIIESLFIHNK